MSYATASDGVRIHYVVEGDGPPLILHHCLIGSHEDWRTFGFAAGLRDRYRLILLDARGHGASDKPHDPDSYSLEIMASDVVAVLDSLELEQAHYYGYSLGGMVGWALGKFAPERFASLAVGGAQPYRPADDMLERGAEMRAYLAAGMQAYVDWSESRVGAWPADFRRRALRNDAVALHAFMPSENDDVESFRFDDAFDRMTMPVLVISGDNDENHAGSNARRAAACLANGTFVEIPDAGHFTLYVRGDLVLSHLTRFLGRSPGRSRPPAGERRKQTRYEYGFRESLHESKGIGRRGS